MLAPFVEHVKSTAYFKQSGYASGKCKSALSGPEDWILPYIRTCLYFYGRIALVTIRPDTDK